jgi:hypothetical protein
VSHAGSSGEKVKKPAAGAAVHLPDPAVTDAAPGEEAAGTQPEA